MRHPPRKTDLSPTPLLHQIESVRRKKNKSLLTIQAYVKI